MDVIRDIRKQYGCDSDNPELVAMRDSLERACEHLSSGLYSTKTHFLLEFVQNADDNTYPLDVQPSLTFVIEDRRIEIACNEVGFNEANVRAICKIGRSTKASQAGTARGYIGEKGIGFKSAFAVARTVHISSSEYTFKFDQLKPLGMMAPIWQEEYPVRPGWTTFNLMLSDSEEGASLSLRLSDINPTILLFLRKLRSFTLQVSVKESRQNRLLQVERVDLPNDLVKLVRKEKGSITTDHYLLVKRMTCTDPEESKRKGITMSEVVLAFPVTNDTRPIAKKQEVHAFLPLRSYGFEFLVQADFLTSSSREGIMDLPWNDKLYQGIIDAFLQAVDSVFTSTDTLRDAWFAFLPYSVSAPFDRVEARIISRLQSRAILRDTAGTYRTPTELTILPSNFCDETGESLVPEQYMSNKFYLSSDYDLLTHGSRFQRLGVRTMSNQDLVVGFRVMDQHGRFSGQSAAWHERACALLHAVPHRDRPRAFWDLRVVPTPDGSWTTAGKVNNYVFDLRHTRIPVDLDIKAVDVRDIPDGSARMTFLRSMRVQNADIQSVAKRILQSQGRKPLAALLEHAMFLFRARDQLKGADMTGLRVVDEKQNCCAASKVYSDRLLSRPTAIGLRDLLPNASFLHPDYLSQYEGQESLDWRLWLRDVVGVNDAPRVIDGALDGAFIRSLSKVEKGRDCLKVLAEYWPQWEEDLNADGMTKLGEMVVTCRDGSRVPLRKTLLEQAFLKDCAYSGLHFLSVGTEPKWMFLQQLGVTTEVDVKFFVKHLLHLRETCADQVDQKELFDVYKHLATRFEEDSKGVLNAFRMHSLILARDEKEALVWRYAADVYWDGPSSLVSTVLLTRIDGYHALADFFCQRIRIKDAPPDALVVDLRQEAEWLAHQTLADADLKSVTRLLVDLAQQCLTPEYSSFESALANLCKVAAFPMKCPSKGIVLGRPDELYVSDASGKLAAMFADRVPLLILAEDTHMPSILPLLESRACRPHMQWLEICVQRSLNAMTNAMLDPYISERLFHRRRFIESHCLHKLHKSVEDRAKVTETLRRLQFDRVDFIRSTYTLGKHVSAFEDTVATMEISDRLVMFVSRTCDPNSLHAFICQELAAMIDVDQMVLYNIFSTEINKLETLYKLCGLPVGQVEERADDHEDGSKHSFECRTNGAGVSSMDRDEMHPFKRSHEETTGSSKRRRIEPTLFATTIDSLSTRDRASESGRGSSRPPQASILTRPSPVGEIAMDNGCSFSGPHGTYLVRQNMHSSASERGSAGVASQSRDAFERELPPHQTELDSPRLRVAHLAEETIKHGPEAAHERAASFIDEVIADAAAVQARKAFAEGSQPVRTTSAQYADRPDAAFPHGFMEQHSIVHSTPLAHVSFRSVVPMHDHDNESLPVSQFINPPETATPFNSSFPESRSTSIPIHPSDVPSALPQLRGREGSASAPTTDVNMVEDRPVLPPGSTHALIETTDASSFPALLPQTGALLVPPTHTANARVLSRHTSTESPRPPAQPIQPVPAINSVAPMALPPKPSNPVWPAHSMPAGPTATMADGPHSSSQVSQHPAVPSVIDPLSASVPTTGASTSRLETPRPQTLNIDAPSPSTTMAVNDRSDLGVSDRARSEATSSGWPSFSGDRPDVPVASQFPQYLALKKLLENDSRTPHEPVSVPSPSQQRPGSVNQATLLPAPMSRNDFQNENGRLAELYVYELLKSREPDFTPDGWTSGLRGLIPGFQPYEGSSWADFTFQDRTGRLTSLFMDAIDIDTTSWSGKWPMYYIEVKSTTGGTQDALHWSNRQIQFAASRGLDPQSTIPPKEVYILICVFGTRSDIPKHVVIVDPLRALYNGQLSIVSDVEVKLTL